MDSRTDAPLVINRKLRVLLIDDNVVPLTLAVIRCLGAIRNLEIHVLNLNNLLIPAYRFSQYVKTYARVNATDDEQVTSCIRNACLKTGADILVPIKEKTVRIVAERVAHFSEFVSVPLMPDTQILEVVRNKWLLYNWLFDKGLTKDKPLLYSDAAGSAEKLSRLDYPCLIKPFWGSGGRGIVLIKDREMLEKYKPGTGFKLEEILIQKFIGGFDIDINALCENGKILAYSIQKNISGKTKLVYSKSIAFVHHQPLLDFASLIFRELNYTGIAHLDFRYDEQEKSFKLIDFNARFWSSILGSLHAGINFPWLNCQKALNVSSFRMPDYNLEKFYLTNNFLKTFFAGIPVKQTEIPYTLKDPLPYFFELGQKCFYWVKWLIRLRQS